MFVIGTAGHVDHGKSTLVQALSGINPDRLREEQEREMTIDLGFAWLKLPSGREVSIIDVPGHEDFIKNMLAGVGGIDVALFVVAADEAVMPQTREHLAILDLLQVQRGIVALTKSDLIEDPEWLELVQEEVREELAGTVLAEAAIIPVSAVTRAGLERLLIELDHQLDQAEPRRDLGRPRLPIDRVFTIAGFGTVVTGTLLDGRLTVGDEVEVLPGGLRARIRGLQAHKARVREVGPGSRVAANLSGVDVEDLTRGQVVTRPGWLEPTTLVDARLRVIERAPWPLKHNMAVDFFSGAARVEAYVRLLDAEELKPGATGWVQLRLTEPVALVRGDRYIIRLASPSMTLAGGEVIQPHPGRRHRRFRPEVIAGLESLSRGTPEDILRQTLGRDGVYEARELVRQSRLPAEQASQALRALVEAGQVVWLGPLPDPEDDPAASAAGVLSRETWEALMTQITRELQGYHARFPLRAGMPREELKSRLRGAGAQFNALMDRAREEGLVQATATTLALAEHRVSLAPEQQRQVDRVMAEFAANPYTPPSMSQVEEALGPELLQVLLDEGRLLKVGEGVLFAAETYAEMERRLTEYLRQHGNITVAQVRDLFDTSRKYALAFMEDMDRRHVTKRLGDVRVLR